MQITTLVDNQDSADFFPEFGLSFLIKDGTEEFLFDTGAGEALAANLSRVGIDPASIRKVILSHGHYDHTGGLRFLSPDHIWCSPEIQSGHYSRHDDGKIHCITMPDAAQNVLEKSAIHWIHDFQAISENLYLTGPIPRISGEDCGGDFYGDEQCRKRDIVPDEQALLSKDGVLITGCCHAGIINTILYCREKHPEIKVQKIVGGLHLLHADKFRLQKTADFFCEIGIRELHLLHCTGENAIEYLKESLPECSIYKPQLGKCFEV